MALPPPLRSLLRDAAWVEAPVVVSEGTEAPFNNSNTTNDTSVARSSAATLPASFVITVAAVGVPPTPSRLSGGRRPAQLIHSRRPLGLLEGMEGAAAAAVMAVASEGHDHGQDGESGSVGARPSFSGELPTTAATAAVKLACHLSEGVAVVVSDGALGLWLGRLSLAELGRALRAAAPSLSLPLPELLSRLERCCCCDGAGGAGAGSDGNASGGSGADGAEAVEVHVRSVTVAAFFTAGRHGPASSIHPIHPTTTGAGVAPESLVVCLSNPVTVLEGYSVPLVIPIPCTRLLSESETPQRPSTASTAASSCGLTREAVFLEMVFAPTQARLVALGEALLLACAESRRPPAALAAYMADVYQQRYRAAVVAAHRAGGGVDGAGDGNEETGSCDLQQQQQLPQPMAAAGAAVWAAHRGVASSLIRGLQAPPALRPFDAFAADLLRFSLGEANRLVEGPTGAAPAATPPEPLGESNPPVGGSLKRGRQDGGDSASVAAAGTPPPRAAHAPASASITPVHHPPQRQQQQQQVSPAPAHRATTPTPADLEADKKKRNIRKLFS